MNKLQRQIIKDALDSPHLLSDWENERINEWAEFDDDHPLTPKQNHKLNEIGTKLERGER